MLQQIPRWVIIGLPALVIRPVRRLEECRVPLISDILVPSVELGIPSQNRRAGYVFDGLLPAFLGGAKGTPVLRCCADGLPICHGSPDDDDIRRRVLEPWPARIVSSLSVDPAMNDDLPIFAHARDKYIPPLDAVSGGHIFVHTSMLDVAFLVEVHAGPEPGIRAGLGGVPNKAGFLGVGCLCDQSHPVLGVGFQPVAFLAT
jgi:hypothetical protein